MAKTRMINTRFWNDGFISQLDPIEKLLFIYFISNEHTNISGIYELPLKIAAMETGIDASMFSKILPRLNEKIGYFDGWVCIKNFPKHQYKENPKVQVGIQNELKTIPPSIIRQAIVYGYPIQDSSHLNLNLNLDSDLDLIKRAKTPPLKKLQIKGFPESSSKGMNSALQLAAADLHAYYPEETFGMFAGLVKRKGVEWAYEQLSKIKSFKGKRPIQFLMEESKLQTA